MDYRLNCIRRLQRLITPESFQYYPHQLTLSAHYINNLGEAIISKAEELCLPSHCSTCISKPSHVLQKSFTHSNKFVGQLHILCVVFLSYTQGKMFLPIPQKFKNYMVLLKALFLFEVPLLLLLFIIIVAWLPR